MEKKKETNFIKVWEVGVYHRTATKNVWNRQKHDSYFQEQKVSNFKNYLICLCDYFLAYLCGFCGSNSDLQAYTEAFHSPLHNYA